MSAWWQKNILGWAAALAATCKLVIFEFTIATVMFH
eukprot:COSAG02_NODE_414_length_22826_cov_9.001364_17_plen_36_part_00